MNENIKSNYYAIIPAIVRYDKELTDKAKLLYGEITCLCNKEGYCFATNNYFANLYNCTPRAIQFTISKLQEKGYIKIIVENNYQRKIYLTDALGYEKIFTPPHENNFIGGYEKNFTHNNIKYNIDDLFILIINNSNKISNEFYSKLKRLEFIYPKKIINTMEQANLIKLKEKGNKCDKQNLQEAVSDTERDGNKPGRHGIDSCLENRVHGFGTDKAFGM